MIQTRRLILEELTVGHAQELFAGLQDPRLYTFLDVSPPPSLASLESRYATLATRRSPDGRETWLNWAIKLRDNDCYAGYVQATIREQGENAVAYLAYVLLYPYWGHCYARESVAALIDHLSSQFHVSAFCATVDKNNARSIALLIALGFRPIPLIAGRTTQEIESAPLTYHLQTKTPSDTPG